MKRGFRIILLINAMVFTYCALAPAPALAQPGCESYQDTACPARLSSSVEMNNSPAGVRLAEPLSRRPLRQAASAQVNSQLQRQASQALAGHWESARPPKRLDIRETP